MRQRKKSISSQTKHVRALTGAISDRSTIDRSSLKTAVSRKKVKALNLIQKHHFKSGDLSKSVLERAESSQKATVPSSNQKLQTAQCFAKGINRSPGSKARFSTEDSQTEREYALRTFQVKREESNLLRSPDAITKAL